MTVYEIFSDPFIAEIVVKALSVGILVSLCASMLGVSLVLNRFSMIGDGLSHVGFFALAIAGVLKMANFKLEVSLVIVVAAAFLIFWLKDNSKIKGDAATALISTGAIAIGSLIFNMSGARNTDICNSLFGSSSIITLTNKELVISILLSVITLVMFVLFYNRIFAMTFDDTFARATGIKTKLYKTMIAILTAITIVLGMEMMGAIMISALVVFPSLSSMRVCKSFRSVVICSAVLGIFCFVLGFFGACRLSFQTGPTVVTVHIAAFLIFSFIGYITGQRLWKKKEK